MHCLLSRLILLLSLSISSSAFAAPIAITNPGFEDPSLGQNQFTASACSLYRDFGCSERTAETIAPGWTIMGSSGVANWGDSAFSPLSTPEGDNAAYINTRNSGMGSSITQQLGSVLEEGAYTLSAEIGNPLNAELASWSLELWAGGTQIGSTSDAVTPSTDTFSSVDFVVVILGGNANLGSLLEIRLVSNDGAAGRVAFDNVQLDADLSGSSVPEPTTAVLFGLGIMGLSYAGRPRGPRVA